MSIAYYYITNANSNISKITNMWIPKLIILQFLLKKNILHLICKENYYELLNDNFIEMLIYAKINFNTKTNDGNTALILAAHYDNYECVEVLCQMNNIDVNAKNNHGDTALILAAYYGHDKCVEMLCKMNNIDVNEKNNYGETAL